MYRIPIQTLLITAILKMLFLTLCSSSDICEVSKGDKSGLTSISTYDYYGSVEVLKVQFGIRNAYYLAKGDDTIYNVILTKTDYDFSTIWTKYYDGAPLRYFFIYSSSSLYYALVGSDVTILQVDAQNGNVLKQFTDPNLDFYTESSGQMNTDGTAIFFSAMMSGDGVICKLDLGNLNAFSCPYSHRCIQLCQRI